MRRMALFALVVGVWLGLPGAAGARLSQPADPWIQQADAYVTMDDFMEYSPLEKAAYISGVVDALSAVAEAVVLYLDVAATMKLDKMEEMGVVFQAAAAAVDAASTRKLGQVLEIVMERAPKQPGDRSMALAVWKILSEVGHLENRQRQETSGRLSSR